MKIVCITETEGLTKGKEYDVIRTEPNPSAKWKNDGYVVINDNNVEKWYEECPMGVIEVLALSGKYVEYIGPITSNITQGKIYPLLDKYSNEYYYFMNDINKFEGISIRNYFGGKHNFINRTKDKEREVIIDNILS